MTPTATPPPLRPPSVRFRRATGGRGAPGRLVAIGAVAAALAALGRALWLRAAARRFARVRGPRFAAAVEGPRLALPVGSTDPADAAPADPAADGGTVPDAAADPLTRPPGPESAADPDVGDRP